jgi:predicted CopG family antitoxin
MNARIVGLKKMKRKNSFVSLLMTALAPIKHRHDSNILENKNKTLFF